MINLEPITPLSFQENLIQHTIQNNCLIRATTGMGKTILGAAVANIARGQTLIITKKLNKLHWYYHLLRLGVSPERISMPVDLEDFQDGKIHIIHHQMIQPLRNFIAMSGKVLYYPDIRYKTQKSINKKEIKKFEFDLINEDHVLWALTISGEKLLIAKATTKKKLITHYNDVLSGMAINNPEYTLCVLDESHKIKSPDSLVTHRLKLMNNFKRRMLLTGTSMSLGIKDLWSQLNFVEPEKFNNYYQFMSRYGVYSFDNQRTRERLQKELFPYYVVIEDHPDLPKFREILEYVPVNGEVGHYYKKIFMNSTGAVEFPFGEMVINHAFAERMRLRQMLEAPEVFGVVGDNPFVNFVEDWLEDNPDANVLIATNFKETARIIADKFSIPHIDDVENYADIPNMTKVVGTIAALGESLDFSKIDYIITSPTQYPLQYKQLCGRLTRLSSVNKMKVIYVVMGELTNGLPSVHQMVWEGMKRNLTEGQMVDEYMKIKLEVVEQWGSK